MLAALFASVLAIPIHEERPLSRNNERGRYFQCFNIVRAIERETSSGKSESEVLSGLAAHCDRLTDDRKNICLTIVPDQVPTILGHLREKRRPDFVCELIGFLRSKIGTRVMSADTCTTLVDALLKDRRPDHPLRGPDDNPEADDRPRAFPPRRAAGDFIPKMPGPGVCHGVAEDARDACMLLSRFVLRGMRTEVEEGMSAEKICERLDEQKLIQITKGKQND
jgi:hypothetical protein